MTLLSIRDLAVTLAEPLFAGLSFALERGDRLGLIAANGRGKSTLFRILEGVQDATGGEVIRARNLTLAHVPQEPPAAVLDRTPLELCLAAAGEEDWRAAMTLGDLGFAPEIAARPLSALSGGWQRLALIARAEASQADVLVLDEPTNHLDLGRIALVERWIAAMPRDRALVIASHDRAFLDAVTNRSLFLRPANSEIFDLPYSPARAALAGSDAARGRRYANDMRRAAELRRQAAKLQNIGINSGSDLLVVKTRQLKERAAKLEAAARPAHRERASGEIRLASGEAAGRVVLSLPDAEVKAPGGKLLFRTGKLWINQGDRVILLGPNGAGKTRLVLAVRDAFAGDGPIRAAPSARLGFADQHLAGIAAEDSPFGALRARFDLSDQALRSQLAGAGIAVDRQGRKVAALSGGQRARLAMLALRLTRPSFYLLDEPTNHLDIDGQEALEAELLAQDASALIVSHDRAFVRAIGTRFWQITGQRLVEVDSPEPFFASEARA